MPIHGRNSNWKFGQHHLRLTFYWIRQLSPFGNIYFRSALWSLPSLTNGWFSQDRKLILYQAIPMSTQVLANQGQVLVMPEQCSIVGNAVVIKKRWNLSPYVRLPRVVADDEPLKCQRIHTSVRIAANLTYLNYFIWISLFDSLKIFLKF
jgi:hypothetical protein